MKVSLILPPSPWLISDTDLPFLGILYLSAFLKQNGITVSVEDLAGTDFKYWIPDKADVYGITGTSPNFPQMKIIAERIKFFCPESKIIAGGPHATLAPDHLLNNSEIDSVIIGPGEKRFLHYLTSDDLIEDPDDYKMAAIPDYEAIDFKKYLPSKTFKYLLGEVNEATVLTTLGCPWRCAFCGQHKMRDKIRYIPIQDVEANIDHLINNYGVKLFYILDDTFGFDTDRFYQLYELFIKKNIKWHCLMRAELASSYKLSLMKESGCLGVIFGFESGSDRILKLMNKKTIVADNYMAAYLTKQYGMMVRGQMIVGFPGEDEESIKETKEFIKNAEVDKWGIHTFQPFPGSAVWANPEKYGITIDKNTDFSDWHTIGRPEEIQGSNQVKEWIKMLKEVAGSKEIGNNVK